MPQLLGRPLPPPCCPAAMKAPATRAYTPSGRLGPRPSARPGARPRQTLEAAQRAAGPTPCRHAVVDVLWRTGGEMRARNTCSPAPWRGCLRFQGDAAQVLTPPPTVQAAHAAPLPVGQALPCSNLSPRIPTCATAPASLPAAPARAAGRPTTRRHTSGQSATLAPGCMRCCNTSRSAARCAKDRSRHDGQSNHRATRDLHGCTKSACRTASGQPTLGRLPWL